VLPSFLVVLFWLWFAAGALILVHRLLTTGSLRAGGSDTDEAAIEAERRATAERHAAFEAQLAMIAPQQPSGGTTADEGGGSAETGSAEPPRDIPAIRPASPSNPDGLLPAAARARTLAEALEGIHMPCDLVPVSDERPDPRHVMFSTSTATAEEVGLQLADELERIGFDLIPIDDRSIEAVRSNARIEVRILPETAEQLVGRVIAGNVVTDFQLT
jgi:hypothetical protein